MRTVVAYLNIAQAILSKIECGQRRANSEQIVKLAEYFDVKREDLLVAWFFGKVAYEVLDEDVALKTLRVTEEI